jgi:heme-degrading monooxygenase HmoA
MFVTIVEFPPITHGKEEEFKEWFSWSNGVFEKSNGFISRRLLKPAKGEGNYIAIVEHKSEKTFMVMHSSEDRHEVHEKLGSLLEGSPKPSFYEVVVSSEKKR